MSVVEVQDIVYPLLVLLSVFMTGLLIATYVMVDRSWVILSLVVYFAAQACAFIWLALVTGSNPQLDIAQYRIWIIYTRMVMALVLIICIYFQAIRIWRHR